MPAGALPGQRRDITMFTHLLPRLAWTGPACAAPAACGGGTLDACDTDPVTADTERLATFVAAVGPGTVRLASADAAGTPGDIGGQACVISADGQQVLMSSASSNLRPGESNFQTGTFLEEPGHRRCDPGEHHGHGYLPLLAPTSD
jgi:hypothetical protein